MTDRNCRVLVVGDPYFDVAALETGLSGLAGSAELSFLQITKTAVPPPRTESESRLAEYAGDPRDVADAVAGHDVLVVHGAPVSAEALAVPGLRMVCCARGGPVNVDVAAATARGIPVTSTPGKNAQAVAELTVAFALSLIRGVAPASRDLAAGRGPGKSVFDGAEYLGGEAANTTLGLVGLGQVGRQVLIRAAALGFSVLVHDPYVDPAGDPAVTFATLDELLARSDVVSLHARATPETRGMMGAGQFETMRRGAWLINTAREQLVDEVALLTALGSGRLAGAALDVVEPGPDGTANPLIGHPRVLVTPHIGGATRETLRRGAAMVATAIHAFVRGEPLPYVVNPGALEVGTVR